MKPELLISKALARKGVLPAEEVLQLARYAAAMREFCSTMLAAYLASEDYALRGGSRNDAASKLDKADTAIEEWAEALYGEGWREIIHRREASTDPGTPASSEAPCSGSLTRATR